MLFLKNMANSNIREETTRYVSYIVEFSKTQSNVSCAGNEWITTCTLSSTLNSERVGLRQLTWMQLHHYWQESSKLHLETEQDTVTTLQIHSFCQLPPPTILRCAPFPQESLLWKAVMQSVPCYSWVLFRGFIQRLVRTGHRHHDWISLEQEHVDFCEASYDENIKILIFDF